MAQADLNHKPGNATVKSSIPTKIKNKVGQTDPGIKDRGKLLKTKKVVEKGWSK